MKRPKRITKTKKEIVHHFSHNLLTGETTYKMKVRSKVVNAKQPRKRLSATEPFEPKGILELQRINPYL